MKQGIEFYARRGTVLRCDFNRGSVPPEITKVRPVVVISPYSRRNTGLCTVIPLSTTTPDVVRAYHHRLEHNPVPNSDEEIWAKCDLVQTVSFARLDRLRVGRDPENKRHYVAPIIAAGDLAAISECVRFAVGLS